MGSMNSNFWLDNGTNVYPMNLRNILAQKLGTATVGVTTYNSEDLILESSAWDTDGSVDNWYSFFRAVPISGTTSASGLRLYFQKNGLTEYLAATFNNSGALTITNSLTATQGNFSGTAGVVANGIYPYNSTNLGIRGRASTSFATNKQIKVGVVAGSMPYSQESMTFYNDNFTTKISAIEGKDGMYYQREGAKQTTDGTQQAITVSENGDSSVLTTVTGKVYQVHAKVVGSTATNDAGCDIYGTFRNIGGTVVQRGETQQIAPNQSSGDWGTAGIFATFTVSGADIRVSVTGKAATTIDWRMSLDYLTI